MTNWIIRKRGTVEVKDIDKRITALIRLKRILNEKPKNKKELICIKYIELGNVGKVADYINSKGYRIKGTRCRRKYTSNDITDIITSLNFDTKMNTFLLDATMLMRDKKKLSDDDLIKLK
jgi:hypothetical protein